MMFFAQSMKKSKAMIKATKTMSTAPPLNSLQAVLNHAEEEQKAFDQLFKCMQDMGGFSEILKKYSATSEDLCKIAKRVFCAGYAYQGRDFLPVAVISFGKPLDYVLANKELILNNSFDEVRNVIEVARTYL